jgi:mono/diheme cytochrome c family protein
MADAAPSTAEAEADADADAAESLAQGEYLVKIAGCNDCHTPGYMQAAGNVPKAQWLVGNPLGFHGPWGTTYAVNLRIKAAEMDEAQWVKYTGELHTRPMMPDFAVRAMRESDRIALHRFIRSLGPVGEPAPAYLPPGQTPPAPYVQMVLPAGPAAAPPAAAAAPGAH